MRPQPEYPRVTALLDLVVNWYKHRHRWGSDLDGLADSDVAGIAKDIGVSTAQLRTLAQHADEPLLLPRLMAALHLDPAVVARREPAAFRDLERVCALCESEKRCAEELTEGDAAAIFEAFCPSALTLKALESNE
jgi:hypothetical protein